MDLIDLHVHSTASDGTLTPSEIAIHAKEIGLKAIALTDHDTINGVDECIKKGEEIGLKVIPGIECATELNGKSLHILGYGIDINSESFKNKLSSVTNERKERNIKMLNKLAELNITLTMEDLEEGTPKGTTITRSHFATAMLRKGYISTRNEAFTKYIGDGGPAYVPRENFTIEDCINMIHSAGGVAVLAHPILYGYSRSETTDLIRILAKAGLDGVESLYTTHTPQDTNHLLQVCETLKLFPTGGSDFHGDNKPGTKLGFGHGGLKVPHDILNNFTIEL